MLMSLFSPVEALCAESIGQKLGFSFATGNPDYKKLEKHAVTTVSESDRKAAASSSSAIEEFKKDIKDGANRSSSNLKKPQKQQLQRRPRFAPELDGVFCFETIVPY